MEQSGRKTAAATCKCDGRENGSFKPKPCCRLPIVACTEAIGYACPFACAFGADLEDRQDDRSAKMKASTPHAPQDEGSAFRARSEMLFR